MQILLEEQRLLQGQSISHVEPKLWSSSQAGEMSDGSMMDFQRLSRRHLAVIEKRTLVGVMARWRGGAERSWESLSGLSFVFAGPIRDTRKEAISAAIRGDSR